MAQDFERDKQRNVGASAVTVRTANSDDALVGINIANVKGTQVNVDVFINDGANDFYLIKDAPIPAGGALSLLDGGAKIVMQSGDILKVQSTVANAVDVWLSVVDTISE